MTFLKIPAAAEAGLNSFVPNAPCALKVSSKVGRKGTVMVKAEYFFFFFSLPSSFQEPPLFRVFFSIRQIQWSSSSYKDGEREKSTADERDKIKCKVVMITLFRTVRSSYFVEKES